MPQTVKSDSHAYEVDRKVAESDNYRLYLCSQSGTERQCLLQIATSVEHNGELQRAAYILGELQRRADEVEAEYARVKTYPDVLLSYKRLLNYKLGFPELLDSFTTEDQGGRQINVLAFRNVDNVSNLVPLANIIRDKLRVDLRTSAWIMGKLLKLLAFVFNEGFSVDCSVKNILIEPKAHYVVIFDWSEASIHSGSVDPETRCKQISQAAQSVITVLGGDAKKGIFPEDAGEDYNNAYTDYLLRLARGRESNAYRAHTRFYEIVDSLWERKYYPFTTKPLN